MEGSFYKFLLFFGKTFALFIKSAIIVFRTVKNYYLKRFLLIASIILVTTVTQAQSDARTSFNNSGTQTTILRFYPNPATTTITFDFQKAYEKGYSIQIYNAVLGRKMVEQTNIANKFSIDLGNFTRGVYVYQLRDKAGKLVETGKFQVSK